MLGPLKTDELDIHTHEKADRSTKGRRVAAFDDLLEQSGPLELADRTRSEIEERPTDDDDDFSQQHRKFLLSMLFFSIVGT